MLLINQVENFKRKHDLVSRKINKFVTKKCKEGNEDIKNSAYEFVRDVKNLMKEENIHPYNLLNADQTGFFLEMHSGRTINVKGIKGFIILN